MGIASLLVEEQGLRFLHLVVVTKVERQAKIHFEVEVEEQPLSLVVLEEKEWGQIRPAGSVSFEKKIMESPERSSFGAASLFGGLARRMLLELTLL